jgi:hypothetical protein
LRTQAAQWPVCQVLKPVESLVIRVPGGERGGDGGPGLGGTFGQQ